MTIKIVILVGEMGRVKIGRMTRCAESPEGKSWGNRKLSGEGDDREHIRESALFREE